MVERIINDMKTWEQSKNVIAFFQSYPRVSRSRKCSIFSTVISKELQLYYQFKSSYDNPEVKQDPAEIMEEVQLLLDSIPNSNLTIHLMTNLEPTKSDRQQAIFDHFVMPFLELLAEQYFVEEYDEQAIDIFTLQGLFDSKNKKLISDVVNTVIYI